MRRRPCLISGRCGVIPFSSRYPVRGFQWSSFSRTKSRPSWDTKARSRGLTATTSANWWVSKGFTRSPTDLPNIVPSIFYRNNSIVTVVRMTASLSTSWPVSGCCLSATRDISERLSLGREPRTKVLFPWRSWSVCTDTLGSPWSASPLRSTVTLDSIAQPSLILTPISAVEGKF